MIDPIARRVDDSGGGEMAGRQQAGAGDDEDTVLFVDGDAQRKESDVMWVGAEMDAAESG